MIGAAVIDASVAVKWLVQEPDSDRARLLAGARLTAPDFLLLECANILWKKVRLHDLAPRLAAERLRLLLDAPLSLAPSVALLDPAFQLAIQLDHPMYDCIYLALAMRHDLPLITADEKLANAVRGGRKSKVAVRIRLLSEISDRQ